MIEGILKYAEKFGIGQKEIRTAGVILVALILVCFAVIFFESGSASEVKEIARPEFGSSDEVTELIAKVDGETYEVSAAVKSRQISEEEKDELFERARSEMEEKLLGENASASRIIRPLDINAKCSIPEVESYFQITDYELIKYDGSLVFSDEFENDTHTVVKLILKIGDDERIYDIDLYLYRPAEDEVSNEELIKNEISKANEDKSADALVLPSSVNGKDVSFSKKSSSILGGIVILGIGAMVAYLYMPYKRKKDERKNRKEKLEAGYSELVSKLSVLVGAGLSVRNAFAKIFDDYKKDNKDGNDALYEEVGTMLVMIDGGLLENEAMMKFAERTGIASYQKLVTRIISCRKNGATKLRDFLQMEAETSFEKRLMYAKRQGEKISSKLLVPMIILFALILLILIIPAFLSW